MFSKNLISLLFNKQICHSYQRSQAQKVHSQIVYRSQHGFINGRSYNQINEQFTDKEIQMQNQYKDNDDELDSLHKGFNEKYLDQFEYVNGNASQSNSWLVGESQSQNEATDQNNTQNNQNQQNLQYSDIGSTYQNSNNQMQTNENVFIPRGYLNFQQTMLFIEQVFTAQEKLFIAQHFFLQVKMYTREIDQKQKDSIQKLIQPVINSINEDPSKHTPATLYYLLNIARHDFLNIKLDLQVLVQIKKHIIASYQSFEIDQIKQVFYACCMMHNDTQLAMIEPQVFRLWFSKIYKMILSGECNERELILFMSYHHKNGELFYKTHKFISHILLSSGRDGILQRSKNGELLKVFISIYCQYECGSLELYELFIDSLYSLIQNDIITIAQFQTILRYIQRSQLFLSTKVISSYPIEKISNQKIFSDFLQDSAFESDGEKADIEKSQLDFINHSQNISQQKDELINENEQKQNLSFQVLDAFVNQKIEQLSCNQVLNVLNLYQHINAQNYRETVVALLKQLKLCFNTQCDNYFSLNITIRAICLFQIQNSEIYLSLFKQNPKNLVQTPNYHLQIANTLIILHEMIPPAWNKQYEYVYSKLQSNIQKDSKKIKQYHVKQQQFIINQKKKYLSIIEQIFERINVSYSTHYIVESTLVDFFIKPSSPNSKKQLLPQTPFTVDIIRSFDEMGPGILIGNLTLKAKIFKSLDIPYITLKEEFCQSLLQLNSFQQDYALIKEIGSQLESQK